MEKAQTGLAKIPILILGLAPETQSVIEQTLLKAGAQGTLFFADAASFARSEKPVLSNALVVLASNDPRFWEILEAQSVTRNRVLHFLPADLVKSILALFPSGTAALADTEVAALPHAILQLWEAAMARQLEDELAAANESGMIQLLSSLADLPESLAQDRARLAFALGREISPDFEFLRRTVRLALLLELADVPNWQSTVANTKNLWSVAILLEQKHLLKNEHAWPGQIAPELAVVETAHLALATLAQKGSERDFRAEVKRISMNLPFSLRTALRIASERVLRSLWEHRYDVA
jgi:hypothetical protein